MSLNIFNFLLPSTLPLATLVLLFLWLREKITLSEGGWKVTASLPFISAVDTLLEVALTEHRTDTKINPSGTKTLEVVLTQNWSVFSVIPGSNGCYIFFLFHYSFFFQLIVRGAVLIRVLFVIVYFSNVSYFIISQSVCSFWIWRYYNSTK